MAYNASIDTDDSAIPRAIRRFLRNRLLEVAGLAILVAVLTLAVALMTWSNGDPSFSNAVDGPVANWLGQPGAIVADELIQLLGLTVIVLAAIPLIWATRLLGHAGISGPFRKIASWLAATLLLAGALSALPPPAGWTLTTGLGGSAGDLVVRLSRFLLFFLPGGTMTAMTAFIILATFGAVTSLKCADLSLFSPRVRSDDGERRFLRLLTIGGKALVGGARRLRERIVAGLAGFRSTEKPDILTRLAPATARGGRVGARRIEPVLDVAAGGRQVEEAGDDADGESDEVDEEEDPSGEESPAGRAGRVKRAKVAIKPGKKAARDAQPHFRFAASEDYELPPLTLLAEPRRPGKAVELSDDALEQNARMLEGVLDDFGVKGQILKVRPGPVVTLYELEPAPGIKSSRVISLADDIARSMSAVSARVAVVSGRNAIGIELPNSRRETVFLRELLASEAFEKTGQSLALALGKNIGGEPVFADLARMPHLLIAGTTGSGKSVGINTMILSLLYRLPPDRCKLIMIDPKMLELSVYEGIPHLLSPVVTDPRKAVVALKWAVREMEERYRRMSKVGVRNIDGYNARMKQAAAKGERVRRTVQTGFDAETGEPIFEQEQIDLSPMPYIVVIIDEMADLMMVAGKDIEGAVQRLAQMARAAGIHVVMATQRPSVDVITGTIKANFPTRISFQVTSKIDSRTILGEQGAEQLLGQGDMLYMAGGGRITRLHAPFVSDSEVEGIVAHLKEQGAPEYVEAVTEETEEGLVEDGFGAGSGGSGDELYDQAVAVVLRDKKVSTSYVQRRLQVGYNKAASLIERMEKEGLISPANATGKREILVPGDSAGA